jgi:hypothetical protein
LRRGGAVHNLQISGSRPAVARDAGEQRGHLLRRRWRRGCRRRRLPVGASTPRRRLPCPRGHRCRPLPGRSYPRCRRSARRWCCLPDNCRRGVDLLPEEVWMWPLKLPISTPRKAG